jgi:imidazolonepropionase-like amidohydrolase
MTTRPTAPPETALDGSPDHSDAATSQQGSSDAVVLAAPRLVDGTGEAVVADAAVWLDRGRIAYAGPAAGLPPAAAAAPRREFPGGTLLPGLIDAHVHLVASAGPELRAEIAHSSAHLTLVAMANARRHLAAGTTLVRDLGAPADEAVEVGRAVDAGTLAGAGVVAAGRALTITGGHIHYLGRVADGVQDVRVAVRENLALGAGCIKVVATGGVLTKGLDPRRAAYSAEELEALVAEAHRLDLHVSAHAIGEGGVAAALRAGVDSVEHGMFLDDETIALFLETGARLVPTFSAVRGILDGDALPWIKERATPVAAAQRDSFRAAADAGVRIVAGTDAGTPGNPHGEVAGEVAHLVAAGLEPLRAIRAVTGEAAELLGVPDRGTLAAAKAADVLVVEGDPVADPRALARVLHVRKDGREVLLHDREPAARMGT